MSEQQVRSEYAARLMDTPSRDRAEALRTDVLFFVRQVVDEIAMRGNFGPAPACDGLYDWTGWLVVADWLDERLPALPGGAVRAMVRACQTVTLPVWWVEIHKEVVAGKSFLNPHHCGNVLRALVNKRQAGAF